jgi:hypothetical protein
MQALRCAVVLMIASNASGVSAQPPEDDPRSAASVHVGPFHLTPSVTVQDMGFDSNVFNSPTHSQSDFTFMVIPHVEGAAGSNRAMLTFKTATELVYFAKHSTERGLNTDLAGGGVLNFGRFMLAVRGTYLNTRRRPNEEIDARARRLEASGDASLRAALFGKVRVEAGTRTFTTRYDASAVFADTLLAETLNRTARTAYAAVQYAVTPLTVVSVGVEQAEERFARSPIRDADSSGAYAAVGLNPRARLSGGLRVGYQRLRPFAAALPEFSGIVGNVALGYRIRDSTQVAVALDRRPLYSYAPEEPYFVWEAVGASLLRSLTSTFAIEVRGRHNWYKYRALAAAVPSPARGRTDTWTNAEVALHYQVNRNLTSTVHVGRWLRQSNVTRYENFNGVRLGTTLLFRF